MSCRWGILGPGYVATRAIIPALRRVTQARVVAVASRDMERAQTVAQQFGIEHAYGDYQALLDDTGVDAVYIALPNHLHHEWTVRAAKAGKHVLCEKPLAITPEECEAMMAACQQAHVYLMEAVMYRFHPRIQYLKQLLVRGDLGALRFMHCAFSFPLRATENYRNFRQYGGGALLDVGSYCVNAARWLSGAEPLRAQGITSFREGGDIDIATSALLHFPEDILGHIQCSFAAAEHQVIEVVGSDAAITALRAFTAWQDDTTVLSIQRGSHVERKVFAPFDPYEGMLNHFSSSVLTQRPPDFPPSDSLGTVRVLQALGKLVPDSDSFLPAPGATLRE